nr:MAG TPA: hypothetical protein [Caudoviricetes sp.]
MNIFRLCGQIINYLIPLLSPFIHLNSLFINGHILEIYIISSHPAYIIFCCCKCF